jgi:DNA-directed RNA polymerase subunit B'
MTLMKKTHPNSAKAERCAVYVNGRLIGFHKDGKALAQKIRETRRNNMLDMQVNVRFKHPTNELFINTDKGRGRRPYIVIKDGKSTLTPEIKKRITNNQLSWGHLIKMGIVEYLDADEEEDAYIARREEEMTNEHTHLEIDGSTMFGVVASILPYPEHNSSPRITMASSMAKQSLGMYLSNYNHRYDTRSYIMYYPQQPMVQTDAYKNLGMKNRAAGQNLVVAVISYKGWNLEDAIVVNSSAVDRGMGRTAMFRTYEVEEITYPSGQKDVIETPSPKVNGFRGEDSYANLDEDGIIIPESEVKEGDVLVGKTSPPRFLEEMSIFGVYEEKKRESSVAVKEGEYGRVDSVLLTEGASGNKVVKVRLRLPKIPEIGDKMASRHGQKGVIGFMVPHEDMPFSESGIVPDLLINPHALPSRMTVGHMLDMLGGKAGCIDGEIMDGTAFSGDKEEKFMKSLKEAGFDEYGEEWLYDGITGKRIKAKIFVGVIYYQRLYHLVSNKMHARSRGPVQLLTLQPTEGRSREGGLRFGEMERDTLIGFGAASVIKERLLEESDKSTQYICRDCGSMAYYNYLAKKPACPLCQSESIAEVEISYAFKLLLDEIRAIGIFPKLLVDKKANREVD